MLNVGSLEHNTEENISFWVPALHHHTEQNLSFSVPALCRQRIRPFASHFDTGKHLNTLNFRRSIKF